MNEKELVILDNSGVSALLSEITDLKEHVAALEQRVSLGEKMRMEQWELISQLAHRME